jgi:hypothetical protein
MNKQTFLFEDFQNEWQKEWVDMPEYNNSKPIPPEIIATFKFRSKEDFDFFIEKVKIILFNNKRVFDGKQKKNEYSAWYPLDSRPSEHIYIVENEK